MKTYKPFEKSAGMLVSYEDMKYRPLSVSRSNYCWIDEDDEVTVLEWKLGVAVHIPFKIWFDLLKNEKEGETGIDLLKRVKNITFAD